MASVESAADQPSRFSHWRVLGPHLRGMGRPVVLSIAITALQTLVAIPVAALLRRVFDEAIPERDTVLLAWLIGGILAFRLFSVAVNSGLRLLNIWVVDSVIRRVREDLVDRIYLLPRGYFTSVPQDELQTAVVADTERIRSMSGTLVGQVLPALAAAPVLLAVLVYLDPVLSGALAAVFPVMVLGLRLARRALERSVRAEQRAYARFARGISFVVRALDLTRILSFEAGETARQRGHIEELRRATMARTRTGEMHGLLQAMLSLILQVVVLLVGGVRILSDEITVGTFFSFYYIANLLNGQVGLLTATVPSILSGTEAMKTLARLIVRRDEPAYSGTRVVDLPGAIHVEGVSFAYGSAPVLSDLSLSLRPGVNIAIQGRNGAGKTTLVQLLLGFYRPQVGRITVDGVGYDQIDLRSFRRQLGVVPQTPFLFTGTVRENVTYGRPDVSEDDLAEALRLALADGIVAALPEGLDTPIGDAGVRLSGGQRQRLVVARVLLGRPRVLILDEPTNHLDTEAVQHLLENLARLPDGPTRLTITHDERLLAHADEAYELRDGRLHSLAPSEG